MRRLWFVVCAFALIALAACSFPEKQFVTPDSAVDAPGPDAFVAPPATHYVMDRMYVPLTNTQARDYGLDLNSDGTVDNQFGMVLSTLAQMGFDLQTPLTMAVDRGQSITLAEVAAFDFTSSSYASFASLTGTSPMPAACNGANDMVCRRHLTGTGSFAVTPSGATRLPGVLVGGTLSAGPGHAMLPLAWPDAVPISIELIGARAKLSAITATTIGSGSAGGGILAGGISRDDIDNKVTPAMQQGFMASVSRDCANMTPPDCGCVQDSPGKSAIGLFDTNPKDCSISVDEIRNNSLIVSLLAPDVMLEGQPAISVGVKFTAVGATFTWP